MTVNSAPSAWESRAGTTAYWLSSPSPGSPSRSNDVRSSEAPRGTTKSGSPPVAAARSRAMRIHSVRERSTGSEMYFASTSLRAIHSVLGRTQESDLASAGTSDFHAPGPPQSLQPAPAAVSREDGCWTSTPKGGHHPRRRRRSSTAGDRGRCDPRLHPLAQRALERREHVVRRGLVDAQRRLDLEDVEGVAGRLHHDTEPEHPLADGVRGLRVRRLGGPVAYHVDAQVEPSAVHGADQRMLGGQALEPG